MILLRTLAAVLAATLFATSPRAEMPSRAIAGLPAAQPAFLAPGMPAPTLADLPAPAAAKQATLEEDASGRMRVGSVRPLAKAAVADLEWSRVAGGYVARFVARSEAAEGLRVRLDLGTVPGSMELRAQGADGRVEAMTLDPLAGSEAWTPWTTGESQVVEVFSAVRPAPEALRLGAVLHTTVSPFAKAAGGCTISTACTSGDAAVDAAVAERKRSVMRLSFVDEGSAFICTGTVINTDHFPAAYLLTANHCISTAATASTLTTLWFYETADCVAGGVKPGQAQVSGGSQLVFTNANVDTTLLLMNSAAPAGAVYSGWNAARLTANAPIVSVSHPAGDTVRVALGTISREYRIVNVPQDMYGVRYSAGITQGGSSGSGLFTLSNGSLQLRGVLSGSTVRNEGGLSCTNLNEEGLYGRFEVFGPEIAPFISLPQRAADDTPNRIADVTSTSGPSLDTLSAGITIQNRSIDYVGDVDLYRFTLDATAYVSVSTFGANIDTVGSILDRDGNSLEAEDDAQREDNHFGITRRLTAGTYYVQVAHWEADGTGPYNLRLHAARVDQNYTDLWWNAAESGWGINFNHQGNILFGTLFTYDGDGRPMWLAMSNGARQPDGSYQGELFRVTGSPFNAVPFTGATSAPVGTMRVSFPTSATGNLTYSYNGTTVTKAITRQAFRSLPSCTWSGFDRSYAANYQDLWWNPAESGWGVNLAHQEDILFATLFTYGADRQPVWYVMSEGNRTLSGGFTGTLYRTSGPPFDASPWRPVATTPVGTMTFNFSGGNQGTMTYTVDGVSVTKSIQRQVFAEPKTQCES